MMFSKTSLLLFIFITAHTQGQIAKYVSSCTAPVCPNTGYSTGQCSLSSSCYQFKTTLNTTFCAPQLNCTILDPCTNGTKCPTNNNVCVTESCCSVPVCMPLAFSDLCKVQNSSSPLAPVGGICANAAWSANPTIVSPTYFNNTYNFYAVDFGLDSSGNIYSFDIMSRQIIKFGLNGAIALPIGNMSNSSYYSIGRMFVSDNGLIYTYETGWDPSATYRLQRYDPNNMAVWTTIFGESTCGSDSYSFCGCGDIFVDRQGAVYCSDYSNSRVIKISPGNNVSASVVAGVTSSPGSALNQLNYPMGLAVDNNNTLYVADTNNGRIMVFSPGSQYGRVLLYLQSPYFLTLDSAGSVYISGYPSTVSRWVSGYPGWLQMILSNYMYSGRVRVDSKGNVYTTTPMYWYWGVARYNILSSGC